MTELETYLGRQRVLGMKWGRRKKYKYSDQTKAKKKKIGPCSPELEMILNSKM